MITLFKQRLAALRFRHQKHDPLVSDVKEIEELDEKNSPIDFDLDEALGLFICVTSSKESEEEESSEHDGE